MFTDLYYMIFQICLRFCGSESQARDTVTDGGQSKNIVVSRSSPPDCHGESWRVDLTESFGDAPRLLRHCVGESTVIGGSTWTYNKTGLGE